MSQQDHSSVAGRRVAPKSIGWPWGRRSEEKSARRARQSVSNDAANTALNQCARITSQAAHVYPSEALVTLRGEHRKAMADQSTTASRNRLVGYLGKLTAADTEQVERAMRLQLALS